MIRKNIIWIFVLLLMSSTFAANNSQENIQTQKYIVNEIIPSGMKVNYDADKKNYYSVDTSDNKAFLVKFDGDKVDQFSECSIQFYNFTTSLQIRGVDQRLSYCLTVTNSICEKIKSEFREFNDVVSAASNAKACKKMSREVELCKNLDKKIEGLKNFTNDSEFRSIAKDNAYFLANKFQNQKNTNQLTVTYQLEPPDSKMSGSIPFDSGVIFLPSDSKLIPKYTMLNYVEMCAQLQVIKQSDSVSQSSPAYSRKVVH
ncbi:MAG: hypothetical protein ACXVCY_18265 [Pseudobdellovibrionaceae bacterium]